METPQSLAALFATIIVGVWVVGILLTEVLPLSWERVAGERSAGARCC